MRRALAALLLVLAFPAAGEEVTLAALFERLAKARPAKAAFVERKYLALLEKPVESRGELAFVPPDTLEKRTTAPKPELLRVEGERIVLERNGRTLRMGLNDQPGVAILVESIRATLAGNLAALTKAYSVGLKPEPRGWRLVLRPLDPAASTLVDRVEIAGAEARVNTVEIFQADGDRSVMAITPACG